MVIVMQAGATPAQIAAVVARVEQDGLKTQIVRGTERNIVCALGDDRLVDKRAYAVLEGVETATPILKPFKLASREAQPADSTVHLKTLRVGGPTIAIIAGPCSVESRPQMLEIAHAVKEAGAHALRGGAFKPRSSPYSFQGMGEEGLMILAEAGAATGLPVVTEVMSAEQLVLVQKYADVLQIGARNMQNYELLRAVGAAKLPVLLKRGLMSTIEELLMSAEYILSSGNPHVILCERGIRTFEKYTRNTTDINAIPVLKHMTHLPVMLDPSHGVGQWEYVPAVARAAVGAGADGLLVEVHNHPDQALSDGAQSLKPEVFAALVKECRAVAGIIGRN